ncbi:SH3 domain-containing protein [Streptomyces sp. NPDC004528]|uniref:SH3 domain-containing protein n=1 Tax=Streptomyces sp. NPDC004528 TaxID=3154550 RepID=UPI0033A9F7F8
MNLRTGPSTGYTSLGILARGVRVTEYCNRSNKWSYIKVNSGANKGRWGWMDSRYMGPF